VSIRECINHFLIFSDRPSFKYFSRASALLGALTCLVVMFAVDIVGSLISTLILAGLCLYIHYQGPNVFWGDVSQAILYHQVRKYLLRLDTMQTHIKYWRPQILSLLTQKLEHSENHLFLCNKLKKGGLLLFGDIVLGDVSEDPTQIGRIASRSSEWTNYIRDTNLKGITLSFNFVLIGFQDFRLWLLLQAIALEFKIC
jgi:potassium/chloride transporter 9